MGAHDKTCLCALFEDQSDCSFNSGLLSVDEIKVSERLPLEEAERKNVFSVLLIKWNSLSLDALAYYLESAHTHFQHLLREERYISLACSAHEPFFHQLCSNETGENTTKVIF